MKNTKNRTVPSALFLASMPYAYLIGASAVFLNLIRQKKYRFLLPDIGKTGLYSKPDINRSV